MGEVITFTSGKGGVGKTTTTANVGVGLSLSDKKVVLVDTDIGLRNLDVVMGLENRILYNLVDVLNGRCRVKQALIRDKRYPNLWIIPSSCSRDTGTAPCDKQMKLLLDDLRKEFDYILIDSPAGIDYGFHLATFDTDRAVIVTTPQVAAIHDADCVLQLLRQNRIKEVNLLINSFRSHMVKSGDMLDIPDICDLLDATLLGVVLEDENIIISQNHGESVIGSRSVSEECYFNIAKRILGEDVPIPDYIGRRKLFSRLFLKNTPARRLV